MVIKIKSGKPINVNVTRHVKRCNEKCVFYTHCDSYSVHAAPRPRTLNNVCESRRLLELGCRAHALSHVRSMLNYYGQQFISYHV